MLNKILMPSGGQTTDEMVILKWNKAVGDFVKRGETLFEIETDKAILTVESFAEGTLLEIKYPEGQLVRTGEIVAYIGEKGDKAPTNEPLSSLKENPATSSKETQTATSAQRNTSELKIPSTGNDISSPQARNGGVLKASPLARSRAKIDNIKLEDIARFFSKDVIRKVDVDNYIAQSIKPQEEDSYTIETSSIRRTIARRMMESVSSAPHFMISVDVDMSETIALRNKLNNGSASLNKISYNDILMKVVARAIETNPLINATFLGDKIKVFRNVNCGLAVAVDGGLVVAVNPDINKKSLDEIASINLRNIEKAKANRLSMQDISGGTITISNLGMFGVNGFTAILNQPESCILAIGSIMAKTIVIDRQMVIRDMMNITGSFDHRLIDGATGAAFLRDVKWILENPYMLLR